MEHALLRPLGFEEIPANELTPELIAVVRDETSRGLDPAAVP